MAELWSSLLIRSGLILGAAEGLRWCMRRRAAADRHRLLLVAFVLVAIWPLLSAVLPEMALGLPGHAGHGTVTVEQGAARLLTERTSTWFGNAPLVVWLVGVLAALIPIVRSYGQVRRMVARTATLVDEEWQDLLARECRRLGLAKLPKLLVYPGPVVPFTLGLRRQGIVLPAECVAWTPVRRRAVLAHELAHIVRRDLFWQLFAQVVTALWWFQPLCWVSQAGLRWESEQACDAVVVQSGVLASAYAQELLAIAQEFDGWRWSSSAIAMVRRGELSERLRAVLNGQAARGRRVLAAGVAAMVTLGWACSALTIFPEANSGEGETTMRHTVLMGLLVSAGLTMAAVTGSAAPASGAPADQEQTAKPKVVRIGANVAEANLIHKVQPVYPASAKAARVQGTVELEATISKEGVPENLRVISSPSDDLSESAIDAVQQWRYRPVLLNGEPIEVVTDVLVHYTLIK